MKVLALNSSPRGKGWSKTKFMLDCLVKGMREAGAEVEVVRLRDKTIEMCTGCWKCWRETPGLCVLQDDMTNELLPKWLESDLVVYATPLYQSTVSARLKIFIERTLPVQDRSFQLRAGKTHNPVRNKYPSIVMLSVAAFPEASVFDHLSSYARLLFAGALVAEIYRSASETMLEPGFEDALADIRDATVQAGRELATSLKVSRETMARVRQPVCDFQTFTQVSRSKLGQGDAQIKRRARLMGTVYSIFGLALALTIALTLNPLGNASIILYILAPILLVAGLTQIITGKSLARR